eukprot:CAMPEP_0184549220 /NCGR_PEP_ID=MMETSP0199_2-20130426/8580_1 /TAXON_ID=1112570 /ORGANISM="Thraustochytrium sp., Strain LLF1b" /LENGTH=68 /DNA_ID=CAMNT_0026943925 /DNA_START=60 /DNA_END=266 /DNA_ORIENTATION=-
MADDSKSNELVARIAEAYPKVEAKASKAIKMFMGVAHWTFLPFVIYVGYRASTPKPNFFSIVNPNPLG